MQLSDLRIANIRRAEEWPGPKASLEFRGLELGGEAGELQNKVKKLSRARTGTAGNHETEEELMADIREEVGDVLITLDLLCSDLGINIGDAVTAKFNRTSEKVGLNTRLGPRPKCDVHSGFLYDYCDTCGADPDFGPCPAREELNYVGEKAAPRVRIVSEPQASPTPTASWKAHSPERPDVRPHYAWSEQAAMAGFKRKLEVTDA